MIPELFAVGTGIASYLEKDKVYNERKKLKERYVKSLQDLLIDKDEATLRLDSVADMFNPAIMQDLNIGAVSNAISGVMNPVSYSGLIPEKMKAIASERGAIDASNREIRGKIAEVSLMDVPRPGFSDFLSGGIEGYALGARMEGVLGENERRKKLFNWLDDIFGPGGITYDDVNFNKNNWNIG